MKLIQQIIETLTRREPPPDGEWTEQQIAPDHRAAAEPGGHAGRRRSGFAELLKGRRSRGAADQRGQAADGPELRVQPGGMIARRRKAFLLAAIVLVAIAGFVSFGFKNVDASRLSRIPNMDSTPGGARQAESEHYRQTLFDANTINADVASESGSSYISIPEAIPELIVGDEDAAGTRQADPNEPHSAPDPVAAANSVPPGRELIAPLLDEEGGEPPGSDPPIRTTGSRRNNAGGNPPATGNPYSEAMMNQMGAIARGMIIGEPESVVLTSGAPSRATRAGVAPEIENPARSAAGGRNVIAILAGTILYGEIVTTVTSDQPSPVVVEIDAGPLAGARLVGSFSVSEPARGLAVEFSKLVTAGGEFEIEAIAVDGLTSKATVASRVDSRLIERFGPGILSSFVSGFAESAARPKTGFVALGDSVVATTGDSTSRQSLLAGVGRAAGQIAADIANAAPGRPEILLEAGYPVGILFVSTAEIPI